MSADRMVVRVLKGEAVFPPPLWMMRQAGRYLPEYRRTRERAGGFLDLCYTPELAVEVTLQPIRRFSFDAAIIFSDILVVPHALGRDLRFEEGHGPRLTPIRADEVDGLDVGAMVDRLEPVYATMRGLRAELPAATTLLGFCGAPWTVATYMIAGHGTPDQAPARRFGLEEPAAMDRLLALLADVSADHLIRQIEAGADGVQIFDSWAGVLDDLSFARFCVAPVARLVARVKARFPDVPIIGFPRGAGGNYETYRKLAGVDALGLDWTVPMTQAKRLQAQGAIQGNLDPLRLVIGGRGLDEGVTAILAAIGGGPLVFNLGHGITPDAPIAHVERLVELVRGGVR